MPAPRKDVPWKAIQEALWVGVPIDELADRYRVSVSGIKTRAKREGWITPGKVAKELRLRDSEARKQNRPILALAESWEKMREKHRRKLASITAQALESAPPLAIESWSDLEKAAKIGNTALGLDQPTAPQVAVLFSGATVSSDNPPFCEAPADFSATD